MIVALGTLIVTAFAQNRWCGPFDLTTTSGGLYSTSEGYQFPGGVKYHWDETTFYISDEGILTNEHFEPCTFTSRY
jgi:hypothetical protein